MLPLVNVFRRLTNSLATRPLATLGAVFIIFATFIGYKSYSKLEQLVITPQEESQRFQRQLESSRLVNQSLDDLKTQTGGQAVVIKQFHNGRHDLTGVPFTEASDTYFTDDYEALDDVSLASMNYSLRVMWARIDAPQCIILREPKDSVSKRYFKQYKLDHAIQCPLVNVLKYPVGIVQIGFTTPMTNREDLQALALTRDVAKSITGYLK